MPMELKYLFRVHYRDGSVYSQSPADTSLTDPKRSAFFDVRQEDAEAFELIGESHCYRVDLQDGHFEADGIPLYVGSCPSLSGPMPGHREAEHGAWGALRLIYFRRHRHYTPPGSGDHDVEYHFGWQALGPDGRNYQQTIILL